MIRIDRSRVPEPRVLVRGSGSPADRELAAARQYYATEWTRQRGSFKFVVQRHKQVRAALAELFHNKCAYCESPLVSQPGDVELYRPKGGVLDARGEFLPQHYWWLALDWSNLYLSCIACNRLAGSGEHRSGKGGRFPLLDEADRASLDAGPEELGRERPLLLDPCRDDVEEHLVYSRDGVVSSQTQRGQVTIELLGLNREPLVAERKRVVQFIAQLVGHSRQTGSASAIAASFDEMMALTEDSAPYAGIARQFVRSEVRERAVPEAMGAAIEDRLAPSTPLRSRDQRRQAKAAQVQFQAAQEDYSLEADGAQAFTAYVSAGDRRIERISIRNLRAIARVDLTITAQAGEAPWLMLLGENATGKSTILQALSLALIGEDYLRQVTEQAGIALGHMVRFGAPFGEISVRLSGASEPRVLRIRPDGTIESSGRSAQLMVLAYGSTRLLPRQRGTAETYGRIYARVENLFDPFIPLVDAGVWLLSADEERFDYAARAIKSALNIHERRELLRDGSEVGLIEHGTFVPLRQLCDGYQTTIALIADILEVALGAWKTPELAQGVVLIDEVGNHLHPSWKMQFVAGMRAIMPGVQVIATTHEPLCLRGLRDGEVARLRRGPRGGISLRQDLPPIDGMRVDQILTSEHFGLASTLDPKLQALFDRYHALLRLEAPGPAELSERESLRARINAEQDLGKTERERRLLEAIDGFLADKAMLETFDDIAEREAALNSQLAEIWRSAAIPG